jgi:hypothetical protein
MNHRPMTGFNRNLGNNKAVHQVRTNKLNSIIKPSIKRLRNSSLGDEEKVNLGGSTINVQTSTQPNTMSAIIPRIEEDIPKASKKKGDKIDASNLNLKSYNNGGISLNKHNNPQNDLNIWRSSNVRPKPMPERIGLSKDGKLIILYYLELNDNPLESDRSNSKNIMEVDRPLFIKKYKHGVSKSRRKVIRPGFVSIKSPVNKSNS